MFENFHNSGQPAILAPLVLGYDRLRAAMRCTDQTIAFAVDRYRRRWRRADRVDYLDEYLGETASALSGLESELDTATAASLSESRKQVQWMLNELRRAQ